MKKLWQTVCGLAFLLVGAAAQSEPRVVGIVGGDKMQCFDNANLGGRSAEVSLKELQDHCAKAISTKCMAHADEMFLDFSFLVTEQTEETLKLDLDGQRVCWVAKTAVEGTGLRVSNFKNSDPTVICDPQGGMGASACEIED